jgi:hypothetical protein
MIFQGHTGPMGPPGFPGPRGEMGLRGPPVSFILKNLLFNINLDFIRVSVHVLGQYHLFNQQPYLHQKYRQAHQVQIINKVCIRFLTNYSSCTTFIFQHFRFLAT